MVNSIILSIFTFYQNFTQFNELIHILSDFGLQIWFILLYKLILITYYCKYVYNWPINIVFNQIVESFYFFMFLYCHLVGWKIINLD